VTLTNCQKSQDATNPDITTDLVAYYPFSGNALDSSGNGFHGTILGVISTTDRSGKRTTSVVNNYSRSMNVLNFGGKFVFNMGTMPLYKRDTIFIDNNQAYMAGSVKNDVGSWNHYAITYDASKKTCDFYYNGKFASTDYLYSNRTDNFLFPVLSSADQCSIGPSMGSSSTEFDELDEIRVFKRVLTADQIAFLATR